MADEKVNIIVSLIDKASKGIDSVQYNLLKFGKEANKAADKAEAFKKKLEGIGDKGKAMAVGFGAVAGVLGLIGKAAIKASGDWETMRTSFVTMLGSAEKADALLQQIKDTASSTPFTLTGLAESSKTLMAFGIQAKDIIPTMRMLGDVSGGNGERLQSLTLAFGQMSSAGRLMGQDLLQMINVGFNPLQEISKMTGKSMAGLKKEMEAGAISSQMVADAFKHATSEGGMFFDGMNKQSQTLAGRWSTLQDAFDGVLRSIGDALMPISKAFVEILIKITEGFNNLGPGMKTIITIIGAIVFAVAALGTGFGAFLAIIPAVVAGMTTLGITISAALWWISGTVIAITALVAAYMAIKAAIAPLSEKTQRLTKEHDELQKKAKSLTDQMKALEQQNKKNSSEYLKLQNELKKTNSEITKNEQKLRDNIKALKDEKKAIEDKIAAQQKDVEKASGDKKIKELQELEALEARKKEIIAASQEAERELLAEHESLKSEIKTNQQTVDAEMQTVMDEAAKAKKAEELEAFRNELMQKSEMELQQAGYTAEQIKAIKVLKNKQQNESLKKGSEEYVRFLQQAAEKETDLGRIVAQGTLDWVKEGLKKEIAARSATWIAEGAGMIGIGDVGKGIQYIAGGIALASAGTAAVNSVQLAEGGIVQPQPGGVSATIAEAGSAEAVIPLDDPEAKSMLGGNQNISVNISGKPLAKEMYEIQQEMIRTGELSA